MEYLKPEYCNELFKLGFDSSELPYYWKGERFNSKGKEYKKLEKVCFELVTKEEATKYDETLFYLIPAWDVESLFAITSQTIITKFEMGINSSGHVFMCKAHLEFGCKPFFKQLGSPSLSKNLYSAIMWLYENEDKIEFSFGRNGMLITEILKEQNKKD